MKQELKILRYRLYNYAILFIHALPLCGKIQISLDMVYHLAENKNECKRYFNERINKDNNNMLIRIIRVKTIHDKFDSLLIKKENEQCIRY